MSGSNTARTGIVQVFRTATSNNPPPANELLDGELCVEQADPMRLWVGVPTTEDPTGRKLLFDWGAIEALTGIVIFAGTYDAATSTGTYNGQGGITAGTGPLPAPSVANGGSYLIVTADGPGTGAGEPGTPLHMQDWLISDSVSWGPLHFHQPTQAIVTSWNTRSGAVTMTPADVSAATGLLTTGDTMTGPLMLYADAVQALEAVPLRQLQATIAANLAPYVLKTGDTMSGRLIAQQGVAFNASGTDFMAYDDTVNRHIRWSADWWDGWEIATSLRQWVGGNSLLMSLNGTGHLWVGNGVTLTTDATQPTDAVTLRQLQASIAAIPPPVTGDFVLKTGDVMSGPLSVAGTGVNYSAFSANYVGLGWDPAGILNLYVDGTYIGWLAKNADLASFVVKTGDTMTGKLTVQVDGSIGASASAIEIQGATEAVMAFHRPGAFATMIGLDALNRFAIGGWSMMPGAFLVDAAGNATVAGTMYFGGGYPMWIGNSGGLPYVNFQSGVYIRNFGQNLEVTNPTGMILTSGNGLKPGGGAWGATSDARIKTIHSDYTRGLAELRQIQPRRYSYTSAVGLDPKSVEPVIPPEDWETFTAMPDRVLVGVVAQEIETAFPDTISLRRATIDGVVVDDLRVFDSSELLYAAINAIKEIAARLDAADI